MLNSLKFLEQDKLPHNQLKAVVELSMLTLSGYMPDVEGCHTCMALNHVMYFDPLNGILQCQNHCGIHSIPVPIGVVKAIEHITGSTIDRLFSFSLSEESLTVLAKVSEAFMLAQLERDFKTLKFYHALI
jgi:DNA repair protein RecO (recombination protein O)